MNFYSKNTKRPHTVIKNIISELEINKICYAQNKILVNLKRLTKNVSYYGLDDIDLALLRVFILNKITTKDKFTIDDVNSKNITYQITYKLNNILKSTYSNSHKEFVFNFLKTYLYKKENCIYLDMLEKNNDKDLLLILKYCGIYNQ